MGGILRRNADDVSRGARLTGDSAHRPLIDSLDDFLGRRVLVELIVDFLFDAHALTPQKALVHESLEPRRHHIDAKLCRRDEKKLPQRVEPAFPCLVADVQQRLDVVPVFSPLVGVLVKPEIHQRFAEIHADGVFAHQPYP